MNYNKHLFICTNQKESGKKCCANFDSDLLFDYLKNKLLALGLHGPGKNRVSKSGCLGRCSSGPCIVVYPESIWYTYNSTADIDEIVELHFVRNQIVERLKI